MKASRLAFNALLAAFTRTDTFLEVLGFTPSTFPVRSVASSFRSVSSWTSIEMRARQSHTCLGLSGFLGQDEEDDDDDDELDEDDDEDDQYSSLSSRRRAIGSKSSSSSRSTFAGLKLDPWDPDPPIKPRPGRFGFDSLPTATSAVPDVDLRQTMSKEERKENLKIMRQIKKFDLADLRLRKDHAGWVEANNDLKRRQSDDPWFGLNDRLREASQMGEDDKVALLASLIEKVGGPPPGITVGPRGYALYTEIYDVPVSASRTNSMLEQQIIEERVRRGRAMAAERKKNMEKEQKDWEDMMRNPGDREDKEAKSRRQKTMRRLLGEIEEDNKKKQERAKELLGRLPETPPDPTTSLDRAIKEAGEDVKRLRRMRLEGKGLGEVSDEADMTYTNPEDRLSADDDDDDDDRLVSVPKSGASKARRTAASEASSGRPRLPGDPDVTRGEIKIPTANASSKTSGPLTVEVSSKYNTEQSDPPMRKHCFQYTIRITNNSKSDTIQLLSRRFEIQTVGSSMKDVVQGEGVTGRQPILKPGEVFEYTSTAPLSVRPIGTTIIAARMKGEYKYVTLKKGQEAATPDQVKTGGDAKAELGMFHFVFPEEQRVKSVRSASEVDDDDDDDDVSSTTAKSSAVGTPLAPKPVSASPASTLPGDSDMTSGDITSSVSDSSNVSTDNVRVQVSSSYRPERSDSKLERFCFAYNVRITNESRSQNIQLVSRRFEIQTIGSETKDVVQGPGVTGRQPILKPGESFEYTSTAPLSVKPMLKKTPVVARMEGEYNFVVLGNDGTTPLSSTPLQAKLGKFHFILPALDTA